jgi:hypothetical protein
MSSVKAPTHKDMIAGSRPPVTNPFDAFGFIVK